MTTSHPKTHPHPNYLAVFGWLTLLTAIEISVSYLPLLKAVLVAMLVTVAAAKASLVMLYFMHLKFDSRWYSAVILVSLFFALLFGWALFKF